MKRIRYLLILVSLAACTPFEAHAPRSTIAAFVNAARVGDYARADELSNDPDFIFNAWQGHTETALRAGHLATYTIISEEPWDEEMLAYCVEFHGSDPQWPIHHLHLLVNEDGLVSAVEPYRTGACQGAAATDATH